MSNPLTKLHPLATSPELCEYLTDNQLRLTFTDLHPVSRGEELRAFVTVRWQGAIPDPRVLHRGTYNLKGARTEASLTGTIISAADGLSLNKQEVLETVTQAVGDVIAIFYDDHRAAPADRIKDRRPRWLLRPLLEQGSVTRLVAQGGSLKSLFALAVCVTVATDTPKLLGMRPQRPGPALFLDWEGDHATFSERLWALCRGIGIDAPDNIWYMQMRSPLYVVQRRVQSAAADLEPVLIVIDSNAMARGAGGEGPAEDSTLRTFGAVREIEAATLVIDHKSDEKIRRGLKGGYGSIFNRNLARLEWEVTRTTPMTNGLAVAMRLEKANNIRTGEELAFRFAIATNSDATWVSATVAPVSPDSVVQITESSNAEKVRSWLTTQTEPQLVAAIALALGLTPAQVRLALHDLGSLVRNLGSSTGGGGRGGLWQIADAMTDAGSQGSLPDPY